MTIQISETPRVRSRAGGAIFGLTRVFNRLVLPLAGTRLVPLYGVLVHQGRRSGKSYRTPVVVRPTADGFIIPMPWGEGTDWTRNILAAGGATVRWKGRDYPLEQPEVVPAEAVVDAFSGAQRGGLARFGIKQCMRLHHRRQSSAAAPTQ